MKNDNVQSFDLGYKHRHMQLIDVNMYKINDQVIKYVVSLHFITTKGDTRTDKEKKKLGVRVS